MAGLSRERVLVVDDEPQVLNALVDTLGDDFDVRATASPAEALQLAATDIELSVVIADQRMPQMTGDELFRRLRGASAANRILVTGYSDVQAVIRAVNDGSIFAFLAKPWVSSDLRLRVQQAAAQFRLQRQLEAERRVVEQLMLSTPDGIYFTNRDGQFSRVNATWIRWMNAANAEALIGHRPSELGDLSGGLWQERQEKAILSSGEARHDVRHELSCGGRKRVLSTTMAPARASNGDVVGVITISRDVTERVQTDEALRVSEERLRLAFQASSATLFDWNLRSDEFIYSATPSDGQLPPAVAGGFATIEARIHPEDLPTLRRLIDAHLHDGTPFQKLELRSLAPDGASYRWYSVNAQAAWDSDGRPLRLVGSILDIDDLRQAQGRLTQAQKLEAIGQLTAGVAHEINTPVQYVTDNVSFVHRAQHQLHGVLEAYGTLTAAVRTGGETAQALQKLDCVLATTKLDYLRDETPLALAQSLEGLNHIGSIVRAMREFAHPGEARKQPVDLNSLVQSVTVIARNEWKYVATLELDLDQQLPLVPMIRNELSQVLLNLIVNAAHAIGERGLDNTQGRILISTRKDAEQIELRVCDNGAGIPVSIRPRVFEPFFTTKEVGKGTGQGLAISYAVVTTKHGGSIQIDSTENEGTAFIVRLPLHPGEGPS